GISHRETFDRARHRALNAAVPSGMAGRRAGAHTNSGESGYRAALRPGPPGNRRNRARGISDPDSMARNGPADEDEDRRAADYSYRGGHVHPGSSESRI